MCAGVRDLASRFQRVQVKDRDPARTAASRDIKPPAGLIRVDIIESTGPPNLHRLRHLVRSGAGRLLGQQNRRRQQRARRR